MQDWIQQVDHLTIDFRNSFGGLTGEELNWKPDSKTWSIGQNIDHLIVINSTYFPALARMKAGNYQLPWTARLGFLVSFFGKTVLSAVQPDQKKKTTTFPIWEPTQSEVPADILDRFEAHQSALKEHITAARELLRQGAVISSPANRYIVYKLETAFEIIVRHEERHLIKAKELLALKK